MTSLNFETTRTIDRRNHEVAVVYDGKVVASVLYTEDRYFAVVSAEPEITGQGVFDSTGEAIQSIRDHVRAYERKRRGKTASAAPRSDVTTSTRKRRLPTDASRLPIRLSARQAEILHDFTPMVEVEWTEAMEQARQYWDHSMVLMLTRAQMIELEAFYAERATDGIMRRSLAALQKQMAKHTT